MEKNNKKIGKGGQNLKTHGNRKHYVVPVDISRVCVICHKLTAPSEENTLKEKIGKNKISVCYEDLRNLNKSSEYYSPHMEPKKPKYYSLTDYFNDFKKEFGSKTIDDPKLRKTLKFIKKTFYKGSTNEFLKTFFFSK